MRRLPLLGLLLLLFASLASAQYITSSTNLGTTIAGQPFSSTVYLGGATCSGIYVGYGGGTYPPGLLNFGAWSPMPAYTSALFSGTPTTPGNYSWTLWLYEQGCGGSPAYTFTLTVLAPVAIATTSLPGATEGSGYSTAISATGGTPGYTFSTASGSLPPGLSMNSSGTISGTPTSAGSWTFTAKVTDAANATATQSLTLTVGSNLAITTSSPPGGIAGAGYSSSLSASGGNPGYSWSVISGSFAPGLSLASGGSITGTPTTAGTYNFTVKCTDTGPGAATKALSITVGPPISIATSSLPNGLAGSAYSTSITVTGGSGSYSGWSISSGSLPPGITNGSTGANPLTLSGTPTTAGTYPVTWANCDAVTSQCASQALSITITPALSITTSSLPNGSYGVGYSQALSATGGTLGYTWAISSGSLPTGVSLGSDGNISGTPSVSGDYSITFLATDSTSPTHQTATRTLTLHINTPPQLTVESPAASAQLFGAAYSFSGWVLGYDTTVNPTSVQILLDGTQIGSGTYGTNRPDVCSSYPGRPGCPAANVGWTYTFAASSYALGAHTIRVVATDNNELTSHWDVAITIVSALSISTTSLPNALVKSAYSQSLTATGGTSSYTWSIATGSLPPGLSLSGNTISGTPTTAGTYNFTIQAADSSSPTHQSITQALSLYVNPPVSVSTTSLAGGLVTTAYSQTLTAAGGTPGYSWSLASGTLPTGLSLNSSGNIFGTPTATGTSSFTVQVTDSTSPTHQTATQALSIVISPALSITTSSLPGGLATTLYSQALAATGGTPSYTWSLASGSLPTGVTLSAAGTISGTPTAAGTYSFTVKATDSTSPTPQTATQTLSIVIGAAVSVATTSLANGLATTPYSQALAATGGTPGYTWTITSGSLPVGLSLTSSSITGTPTAAGTYNFTVQATDSTSPSHQTATQALSIVIGAAVSVTTTSLPNGLATTLYSQALAATGGTPGYTWTITSGSLPNGLSLTGASISGTPTAAGTYNFTVQATDSTSPTHQTATQALSIVVGPALSITTTSLPNALAAAPYSQTLAATGGTPGYTWSLASGSLPTGLTLSAAGTVSGTPTTAGSSTFTLKATDSTTPTPQTATQTVTLSVTLAFNILTTTLPNAVAGTAYSQTLVGNGGTAPYTWAVNSGSLPPGLSISSSTITGTPNTPGTFNFTIKGSDATSPTAQTATQALSIVVGAAVSITTTSLPNALATTAYSQPLAASGGTSPYTWTLSTGSLPPGLSLTPTGSIYGTPSTPGAYPFTVQVADGTNPTPQTLTKALTITVAQALTITTSSLPTGMVSTSYSQTLAATGGTPGYTWSLASGSLPNGLTLSAAGALSGTPTAAGLFSFVIQVTDTTSPSAQTATRALSLNTLASVSVTTSSLPNGLVSTAYTQTLAAIGGTPGYAWSLASGSLPPGLSVSSAGTISGTPNTAGAFTFTVKATDSTSPTALTATQSFTVTIGPALTITTTTLPNGIAGSGYAQILAATGGTGPYTWSVSSGSLPAGLTLTPGGGLSGTLTASGPFTFTVKATDSTSPTAQTATQSLTLNIAAGLSITTTTLPAGLATTAYSQTLAAAGGTAPYTWSIASGSLPTGLNLSSAGTIAGTPTAAGTFAFVVKALDTTTPTTQNATQALSITVAPALSITTPSLAAAMVGQTYSQTITATGGTPAYTWSISSGSVPSGLSLSGNTISGTPTAAGTSTFTVMATDSTSPTAQTATGSLSIVVGAAFQVTTSSPLPPGLGGNPYNIKLQAMGGTSPYTFTLASGAPPAGLTLQSDGTLSGVPSTPGRFLFSVLATDSTTPTAQTQIKPLAITITPPLAVSTTSLPRGLVGSSYAQSLLATGGTPLYSWTITSGALPQGLTLSTDGAILGTPTESGAFMFAAHVTDNSPVPQTATEALSLTIGDQLTITTSSLPPAVFGATYNYPLSATGGTTPYRWTLISGTLPPGLSLSAAGYIVGTCTGSGIFTITVQATDSTSPTAQTATRVLTVDSNTSLSITSGPLPPAQSGQAYTSSLTAAGGVPPYTWSIAAGSLPTGLTLSAVGTISGTPTVAGTSTVSFQVADSAGNTSSRSFSLSVSSPLAISTNNLPAGSTSSSYATSLTASGGATPYTWTVIGGTLPTGVTLSTSGLLSGGPTTAGTSTFTVQVTDNTLPSAQTATKILSIAVTSPLSITSPVLPNAITGTAYSQTLTATGGTASYTWSVTSGTLPAGVTLDGASGSLSGTPAAAGTSLFSIQATDSGTPKQSTSRIYSITVVGPLTITTNSLPQGLLGHSYNAALAATGGQSPYIWSITAGSLPDGLTLSPSGTIGGTPTTPGTSTVTVQATDSLTPGAQSTTHDFTIAIAAPLSVTTTTLPATVRNSAYSQPLSATGGATPYTWSLSSGQLPQGLALSADGTLSGKPTATGGSTFTVKVTDAATPAQTATQSLTIVVVDALTVSTAAVPNGTVGAAYTASLGAAGGTSPYTWSLATGTLPPGLSLESAGTIVGTPTTPGTSLFSLQVADSSSSIPQTATHSYTITVIAPLTITTATVPSGLVGALYSQGLDAIGGTSPYTWTISTGSVPSGLSLAPDGTISGTPSVAGVATFTAQVTDSATPTQSATQSFTINVVSSLTITTTSLSTVYVGQPINDALSALGGTTPYTWTISSGQLPDGVTLAHDGTLTGSPTAPGISTFTVQVSDAGTPTPQTAKQVLSLTVLTPLLITTPTLPPATTGTPYSQALLATGGATPYAWSLAAGSLPPGLVLSPAGTITGTPTTPGPYTFTARVSDTGSPAQTNTQQYTITVVAPLTISTTVLASGLINTPYSQSLTATGGLTPYTWSLASGSLPPGLALNANGTITGTPAAAGSAVIVLQAIDGASQGQQTATRQYTLSIASQLVVTTTSLTAGLQAIAYTQTLAATGGTSPYTWSLASGQLPGGLTISATGTISGTPAASGTYSFTVQATDASQPAQTATQALSILVNPPLSITTTSLPNPKDGVAYSQPLAAAGGTVPYTWISNGSLPTGLVLNPNGTISGTPTGSGTFSFTVQVTDTTAPTPETATANFVLQTTVSFQITSTTIPAGIVGVAYSVPLTAAGGSTPYTWTATTGTLPAGLALSPSGTISGIPTAAGTYTFTVQASDNAAPNRTSTATFTVQIQPPLTITTTTITDTTVGANYTAAFTATGGNQPYTWSITIGTLPSGLTLKADGTISGIPLTVGNTTFTIQVSDATQPAQTASKTFTLNVTLGLTIANNLLTDAYINTPYATQFNALGGLAPYTWSATGLPDGLALSPTGYLSGSPTTTGTFTVNVSAHDAYTPIHTASKTLALNVRSGLVITTTTLPDGHVSVPYSQTLSGLYGVQPYIWTVLSGSMAPGLGLSVDGTITGTPTTPGGYTFVVQLADSSLPALKTTQTFSLAIQAGLSISTTSLPAGAPGTAYSATLQATGGTKPYAWTIASGTLPPGLVLSADGTITGTPTTNGSYSVTIQVADAGSPQLKASRLFSIAIGPSLTISTTSLADARLGVSYRQAITALNGTQPYYWTLTDGTIPPGLLLLASGDIVGQPAAIGTFTFTVNVQDNAQPPASANQTFTIKVAPGFAISTTSLPSGTPGTPYQATLTADHGTTPYTWSLALGDLPQGVTLNATTGTIAGTPKKPGIYNLLIQAADSTNPPQTTTAQFTLTIDSTLQITTATLPDAQIGVTYYQPLAATNGVSPFTWSPASALPPGLSLLPSGEIYGVPTTPGQYKLTVAAADSSQPIAHASRDLTLLVSQTLTITTDNVPSGLTSKPYVTVISAAGGTPPYRFTANNPLPAGLTLASVGTVIGTPTTSGTYKVTIQVTDATGTTQSRQLVFVVGAALAITTTSLPTAPTAGPYFATLAATGGTGSYTWIANANPMPPGITFLPSIGAFVGTPTAAGQYPVKVSLSDGQQNASTTLTITITDPLAISPAPLPAAQQSLPYSTTLAATGGVPPYSWALGSGSSLPSGLALSTRGVLAGQVTANPAAFSLSLCVTDSAKPQAAHTCAVRSLVVGPAFHIDPAILPNTIPGQPVSYQFTESGAQGKVTWTAAFALPTGISLTADGILSGTPSTAGTYDLTVIATDTANEYAVADFAFVVSPPLTVATTLLPPAILGTRYAAGIIATSGQPPYVWTADPATLPAGFVLDPSGILYGSPSQTGTANISVTVSDASSPAQNATGTVVLSIDSPLTITDGALPPATAGSTYTTTLAAAGIAPLQWSIVAGQLPSGLTLTPDGTIGGLPLAAGTASFVASVVDAHGQTSAAAFSLIINPSLTLGTNTTLPDGTVGERYTYTFTTTFTGTVSWTLLLGTLPAGLSLSPDGIISGSPTTSATTSFMLQATGGDQTARQVYTITVDSATTTAVPTPTIPSTGTQLPAGNIGQPYAATLTATGGTQPYAWAATQGQLPGGLTLASAGVLSGNPTDAGSFSFALTVTDANNQTASALFTVTILGPLTITSSAIVTGHVGSTLATQFTATGGTPPYVWSAGAPLPTGLALSTSGLLSGSPNGAASTSVTITVHDSSSATQPATATLQLELDITAGLAISTTSLPAPTHNTPYSATLTAVGGTAPYTWTMGDSQLPPGLSLASGGVLTGTPSTIGSYRLAILVTDAAGQSTTASFALSVSDPIAITTAPSISLSLNKAVNLTLAATGGTPPYVWSISTGTLPAGLSLSSAGVLSGSVSSAATATITISVHDAAATPGTTSQQFTISATGALSVGTTSLPTGYLASPYTATLQASGGIAPYAWSTASGSLPPGLNLSADGLLTGTPTKAGSYTFAVSVADGNAQQAATTLTCSIATLAIISTSLPNGTAATPYIASLDARGGVPPYSWSSSSAMPQGLLFTPDGVITGTPTGPFTGSLAFSVTDQANTTASVTLPLTIASPATGHLQIAGLTGQLMPTAQTALSVSLDQPAPMDLTGQLTVQFAPDAVGRDDATLAFVPAGSRTLSFTIAKGALTAHFQQQPTLQAGTSAGAISVTASISTSPNSTATATSRIPGLAPFITAAHVLSHDAYTLTLEIDGYSTTAEVSGAHFTFQGIPTQSDFNIDVKALFAAWYASQPAANQGGTFQYKQSFNFTGDTSKLSSVSVSLTNSVGTTAPYAVSVQ